MQSFKHVRIPSLSSLYVQDGRLPNVGAADYSRIPRLRRHKWTAEEKQVLYLLSSNYNNPSGELWRIFNAHFRERRRHWLGPRKTAWETMRVFNMDPLRYRVWWTDSVSRRVETELARTALSIGIQLLPKYDGIPSTPVRRRRKRMSLCGPGSVESAPSAKRATVTNGLLTPPPTAKKNRKLRSKIQTNAPVPSIAFRGKSHTQSITNSSRNPPLTYPKLSTRTAKESTAPTAS